MKIDGGRGGAKTMKSFFFSLTVLVVAACSSTTDISKNPSQMTDFVVGRVYALKKPAYLWKSRVMPRELADSEGRLGPGTTLAIRKVQVDRSPEMGTLTDVFAEILTGPLKGVTGNVTWISELQKTGYVKRDAAVLVAVEAERK